MKKKKPSKTVEFDDKTDIKEMGDVLSGTTSEIVQVLLNDVMKCFLYTEKQIRIYALQVIANILRQGLVHPAQVRRILRGGGERLRLYTRCASMFIPYQVFVAGLCVLE